MCNIAHYGKLYLSVFRIKTTKQVCRLPDPKSRSRGSQLTFSGSDRQIFEALRGSGDRDAGWSPEEGGESRVRLCKRVFLVFFLLSTGQALDAHIPALLACLAAKRCSLACGPSHGAWTPTIFQFLLSQPFCMALSDPCARLKPISGGILRFWPALQLKAMNHLLPSSSTRFDQA